MNGNIWSPIAILLALSATPPARATPSMPPSSADISTARAIRVVRLKRAIQDALVYMDDFHRRGGKIYLSPGLKDERAIDVRFSQTPLIDDWTPNPLGGR
jgi:hypothetical protein